MAKRWTLTYASAGALRAHLEEHAQQGVVFLSGQLDDEPGAFERVSLLARFGAQELWLEAEVIQVLPSAGVVVRLMNAHEVDLPSLGPAIAGQPPALSEGAEQQGHEDADAEARANVESEAELEALDEPPARDDEPQGPSVPLGSSVISWPIEKLQAEWDAISLPDKIRVARHGKRPARAIILRSSDRTLLAHVLNNPSIGPEEVAVLAASPLLDPSLLRRIAANREWLRATEVTRNLICNPKLPLPEVERLLRYLSPEEMQRLAKSGRVRASVRAVIVKRTGSTK